MKSQDYFLGKKKKRKERHKRRKNLIQSCGRDRKDIHCGQKQKNRP